MKDSVIKDRKTLIRLRNYKLNSKNSASKSNRILNESDSAKFLKLKNINEKIKFQIDIMERGLDEFKAQQEKDNQMHKKSCTKHGCRSTST